VDLPVHGCCHETTTTRIQIIVTAIVAHGLVVAHRHGLFVLFQTRPFHLCAATLQRWTHHVAAVRCHVLFCHTVTATVEMVGGMFGLFTGSLVENERSALCSRTALVAVASQRQFAAGRVSTLGLLCSAAVGAWSTLFANASRQLLAQSL